jgi:NADH dehydrogenase (ubiquinone) Fe-S protein 1
MVEISPALAAYDVVEPVALPALSKVQLVDQNKGAQVTGTPLKKVIDNFYFTDVISRRYVNLFRQLLNSLLTVFAAPPQWHAAQRPRQLVMPGQTLWLLVWRRISLWARSSMAYEVAVVKE